MKHSFFDHQDLLFHADFTDLAQNSSVDEELLLERSWERTEAELALPKYQKFKKYGNALYCGCKLALHHRVLIEILYFHASDALSITFTAPSIQFYQSKLVTVMCSSAQMIDSSFKTSLQQVELSFTSFD
ncbi:MAG: hypothetical protein IJW70_08075 [Clostridia bacterium]|nr:hypothetical protein [Clostridia bacterium]